MQTISLPVSAAPIIDGGYVSITNAVNSYSPNPAFEGNSLYLGGSFYADIQTASGCSTISGVLYLYYSVNGGAYTVITISNPGYIGSPTGTNRRYSFSSNVGSFSAGDTIDFYFYVSISLPCSTDNAQTGSSQVLIHSANSPIISNVAINPSVPGLTDSVTVSANVYSASSISFVVLYYSSNLGSSYSSVSMTGSGSTYTGTIPAQYGAQVVYYLLAVDSSGRSSTTQLLNSGFESGTLSPWTTPNPGASIRTSSTFVHSGNYGIELDYYQNLIFSYTYVGTLIEQQVSMPVSTFSSLSFYYNLNPITVQIDYTDGSNTKIDSPAPSSGWSSFTVSQSQLSAGKTINTIILAAKNTGVQTAIDDIVLNPQFPYGYGHSYGPIISNIAYSPPNPTSTDQVTVTAKIGDANGINSARLYFSKNPSAVTYNSVSMGHSGNTYSGILPPQSDGRVYFYIQATDTKGNTASSQLVNGGFETGSLTPWTTDYASPVTSPAINGQYSVELDHNLGFGIYNPAYIQQQVLLSVSSFQSLSFYYGGGSPIMVTFTYTDGSTSQVSVSGSLWSYASISPSQLTAGKIIQLIRIGTTSLSGSQTYIDNIVLNPQYPNSYNIFTPDTNPPLITNIIQNVTNPDYTQSVMISATITDASGVNNANLFYSTDNGVTLNELAMSNSGSTYYATINAQPYNNVVQYFIQAFDINGYHINSTQLSYTVIDDISPNILGVIQTPANPQPNNQVNVTISVKDAASGVKNSTIFYNVDSSSSWLSVLMTPLVGTYFYGMIPGQPTGSTVKYYVKVFDNAGNSNQTQQIPYSLVDTTPPSISPMSVNNTNPQDYDFVNVSATITDSGSGVKYANLSYSIDGNQWINVTMTHVGDSYSGLVSPQSYGTTVTYKIIAIDNAGNIQIGPQASYTVQDTSDPVIANVQMNPSIPSPSNIVHVNASITDTGSGLHNETLYYSIDNQVTWIAVNMISEGGDSYGADIPAQIYNTNVFFYIKAYDNQNNPSASTINSYIVGDQTPPDIYSVSVPSKPDTGSPVAITAGVTDTGSGIKNVTLYYQVNLGTWNELSMGLISGSTYRASIPAQNYHTNVTYYVVTFDIANNRNQSLTYKYEVGDYSGPLITNVVWSPTNPQPNDYVSVNLTATDSVTGVKSATLFYSTDNELTFKSLPMTHLTGDIYNATIPPYSVKQIYFYVQATDNAGNIVSIGTYYYIILDTYPPNIISTSYSPNPTEANQNISVITQISDIGTGVNASFLLYSIDNGVTWQNITMQFYSVGLLGNYYRENITEQLYNTLVTFYIEAIDNAGNIAVSQYYTFTVSDTINPKISFVKISPSNPVYVSTTNAVFSITDSGSGVQAASIYYSTDGGTTWNQVSMSLSSGSDYIGTLPTFPYATSVEFYGYATDFAGNSQTTSTHSFVVIDNIKPAIGSVHYSPIAPTYTDNILINVSVTDPGSGIYNVTLFYGIYGSSSWAPVLMTGSGVYYTYYIPAQPSGTTIQYFVKAFDNAGNFDNSSTFTFTSDDTTPPVLTYLTTNPSPPSYDSGTYVFVKVSDIGSGVQNATVYFKTSTSSTWIVNSMYKSIGYYVGSIDKYPYGTIIEFFFVAFDGAGNKQQTSIYSATVADGSPPNIVSVTRDITSVQATDTVHVSAIVGDGGSGVQQVLLLYSTDTGTSWTIVPMPYQSSSGSYTGAIPQEPYLSVVLYKVEATDNAGNSINSSTYSYTIGDITPPSITNVVASSSQPQPSEAVTISATVTETGSGLKSLILYYSINNGNWITVAMTYNSNWQATIPGMPINTVIQYKIGAVDNAGNAYNTSIDTYTVLDTTAPIITNIQRDITSPAYNDTVTITASVSDAASGVASVSLQYSNDSASIWYSVVMIYQNSVYSATIPTQSYGLNVEYKIIATDNVGNVQQSSVASYTVSDPYNPIQLNVAQNPINPEYNDSVVISSTNYDNGSGILSVQVFYSTDNGVTWSILSATSSGNDFYVATIPSKPYNIQVLYKVVTTDNAQNKIISAIFSYVPQDTYDPVLTSLNQKPMIPNYTDSVNITISAVDSGSGVESSLIFYSTDGGVSWTQLIMNSLNGGFFTQDLPSETFGTNVLYFVSITDNAGNNFNSSIINYNVIDNVAPVIAVNSPIIVYELGSGGNSITWTIDEVAPKNYTLYKDDIVIETGTFSAGSIITTNINDLSLGTYIYRLVVFDTSDNSASVTVTVTVHDTTTPIFTNIPADLTYELGTTAHSLSWTATDLQNGSYILYRDNLPVNQGKWISGDSFSINVDYLLVGKYNFTIVVSDDSGNSVSDQTVVTVQDTTPPTFTNIPADLTYELGTTGHSLSWTATDLQNGIYTIYINNSEVNIGEWISGNAVTVIVDNLNVGFYNFTIVISDNSANSISSQIFVTVQDTTPPVFTNIPTDLIYEFGTTGNSLSWTVTDLQDGSYSVLENGTQINSGSWSSGVNIIQKVDALTPGIYNITIVVSDKSGNSNSNEVIVTVQDSRPPELISVSVNFTYELGTNGHSLSWTATDLDSNYYTLFRNNSAIETNTWASGIPITTGVDGLGVGLYNFTILIYDSLGNSVSNEIYVTVQDTTAPVFNNVPTNLTYELGTIGHSLSWIATDLQNDSYSIYKNDSLDETNNWDSGSSIQISVDYLNVGFYNFTIVALDKSDNMAISTVYVTVQDTTAPVFTNTPTDFTYELGTTVNSLQWVATDLSPDTYTIYQNKTVLSSGSWISGEKLSLTIDTLPVDVYNFTIVVTDNSGNTAKSSVFVTVQDTTAPVFTNVPADLTYELGTTGHSLSWTATDLQNDSYSIYQNDVIIDSNNWDSGSVISISVDNLPVGSYNYTIVVSDKSENTATNSVFVTVQDTTAPVFTNVPANLTYIEGTTDNSLSWVAMDLSASTYNLYQNATLNSTGTWSTGQYMNFSVDGLSVNIYNFTLVIADEYGNSMSSTVWITVIPSPHGHQSLIKFKQISISPKNPSDGKNVTVSADISSVLPLSEVILHYKIGNGAYTDVSMTQTSSGLWSAKIGPFKSKDKVTFYITATDTSHNSEDSHINNFTVKKNSSAPSFELLPLFGTLVTISIAKICRKQK